MQQWRNEDYGAVARIAAGLGEVSTKIGDVVSDEEADYFLCVLPPACMTGGIIQIGEPNSHVNGRATYATIKRTPEGWVDWDTPWSETVEPVEAQWLDAVIEDQQANFKAAGS